jgi:transcriptional regulator with XRE-family HTH domain
MIEDNITRVGRRLARVRQLQGARTKEADWTQQVVANRTGLSQNIITRIEQGRGGSLENFLILLNYYRKQGYSLDWILAENNSKTPQMLSDPEKQ